MSDIEWTDRTWNPIVGCTRVSPGCEHCYAERFVHRGMHLARPARPLLPQHREAAMLRRHLVESALGKPLSWRKPQRVFVNSLSDLWHEGVSNEACAAIFGVMAACPHLTFQVLTKRPKRMQAWFEWISSTTLGPAVCADAAARRIAERFFPIDPPWPLANVWLGVTAEDQQRADERIPLLLDTPAAVRFVSYEPALGPVRFDRWLPSPRAKERHMLARLRGDEETARAMESGYRVGKPCVDWLIIGGESGTGARQFDLAWMLSAVEQCDAAGVPVFCKQIGADPFSTHDGLADELQRLAPTRPNRKGGDMAEWPADLRVREFPR